MYLIKKLHPTICALIAILLAACAPVEKKWDIVWPLPPEEPRIKYVGILRSSLDVEKPGGLMKALVGPDSLHVLRKPYGIATDKEGRVYVSDIGRVFVFDRKNRKFSLIGDEGTGKLSSPVGIAVSNKDGKVYVTDIRAKKVFVYDQSGKLFTAIGKKGELENPTSIALDEKRGKLYVTDSKKHNVMVYSLDGSLLMTLGAGKRSGLKGEFSTPSHIALDSNGNFYVVDTQNFRVQVFNPDGKHLRDFGSLGDGLGNFARPKGIAIDSEDNIYVVDAVFNNVQIFDKEGQLLLFFGSYGSSPGQLLLPAGIAIDNEDRIYVTEQFSARVQVFQYLGEKDKKGITAAEKAEGESGKATESEKTTDIKEEKKAGEH